jgi:hypothetical protein
MHQSFRVSHTRWHIASCFVQLYSEQLKESAFANMQTIALSNGLQMPMLGLGLSHMGGYSSDAVVAAAKEGIRLFDTAARYGNEEQVHILVRKFQYSILTDFLTQFACWFRVPCSCPAIYSRRLD